MSKLKISSLKRFAGEKWSWQESISDYPSSSYDLKVVLKYQANNAIVINASAAGEDYLIEKIASETSALPSGDYAYQVKLTDKADSDNVILCEDGVIHIYPNLESAGDARTYCMKQVENLKAAYEKLTSREMKEVIVNGKRVLYEDRIQLLKEIHNAEIKAGLKKANRKILTRFT